MRLMISFDFDDLLDEISLGLSKGVQNKNFLEAELQLNLQDDGGGIMH